MDKKMLSIFLVLFLMSSCASVTTERHKSAAAGEVEEIKFPEYLGEPLNIQIINFTIPAETIEKYPELNDRKVGWGMCNRIIDIFYETGQFSFIEEKDAVRKKILDNWKLKASGITVDDEDFEAGLLEAPDYFVYAEVYDFAVRQNETVIAGASEKEKTTIIGIQLRLLDTETGKFIPASGIGEASSVSASIWMNPKLDFDQSTVGLSTERAVRSAVFKLLKRI